MTVQSLALIMFAASLHAANEDPPEFPDITLQPAPINQNPGLEYTDEHRSFAMAAGIERTEGGRLWAAWVAGDDGPAAYLVVATSDDDGMTWSHPRLVIHPPKTESGLHHSVLVNAIWMDPHGKLWVFYSQSLEMFDGRAGVWSVTCDNPDAEKPTWSEPRRIWHGWTLNRPTVLNNGDWMLPVSLWHRGAISGKFREAHRDLDDQRMAHWFVSRDFGKTWARRGGVKIPGAQYDEHMLVELKDGRLWMLARTQCHFGRRGIAQSLSKDKGATWSRPLHSDILAPATRFFIRRLQSGNLLLVKNRPMEDREVRSHLTASLSSDEGKTWLGELVLDERDKVSYPDGVQAPDGSIYVLYDRDRRKECEILFAKFTEADVLAGEFVSKGSKSKQLISKGLAPHKEGRK